MTLDHLIPRHDGGSTSAENCVSACVSCNSRKGRHQIVTGYTCSCVTGYELVRADPCNPPPVPSLPIPTGDPLTPFAISSGARGSVVGPSAGQVQTRFKALFEDRFDVSPYMGGGQVIANFPQRLRETAAKKNLDPLELLGVTFAAWAAKPLDEISQNAPYAAFAARFGSLCGAKGANGGPSELDELHAAQTAALAARDMVRYESLVAEEKRRAGGAR